MMGFVSMLTKGQLQQVATAYQDILGAIVRLQQQLSLLEGLNFLCGSFENLDRIIVDNEFPNQWWEYLALADQNSISELSVNNFETDYPEYYADLFEQMIPPDEITDDRVLQERRGGYEYGRGVTIAQLVNAETGIDQDTLINQRIPLNDNDIKLAAMVR
jgi:hypothetical protein